MGNQGGFSEWKSGDDFAAMKREVPSLEDLHEADAESFDEGERREAVMRFTTSSLPDENGESEEGS